MQALTFVFAFVAVLALIGLAAWLVRRFAGNRLGANTNRGRMPRLAVIDAAAVDGRRRLVLVRRDNIEHLLMIGGPTDIVVESNIVRATTARDPMPQRPAVGGGEPAPPTPSPPPRPPRRPRFSRRPNKTSPRWRSASKPRCAGRPATPATRASVRRRWPPNRRRSAPPRHLALSNRRRRRLPRRRRRAALRISKTRWRHCWAVQRTIREAGRSPA